MSMRNYGFDDYGLVLDNATVLYFANQKLAKEKSELHDDECLPVSEFTDDDNIYEAVEYCDDFIQNISAFEGELCKISAVTGQDCWENSMYAPETVFYISVSVYPSFFATAYKSYDELIDDFKTRCSEYLPKDFDYENNFRHIVGTYFG